jgi:hypothetical protein
LADHLRLQGKRPTSFEALLVDVDDDDRGSSTGLTSRMRRSAMKVSMALDGVDAQITRHLYSTATMVSAQAQRPAGTVAGQALGPSGGEQAHAQSVVDQVYGV